MNPFIDIRDANAWPRPAAAWGLDFQAGGGLAVLVDCSGRILARAEKLLPTRAAELGARGPVAACLGCEESLLLWISAPLTSVHKAVRVFPSMLDIQLPFPVESCATRFLAIGKTPERTVKALAIAARIETIRRRLETCRAAGWDPLILDHEGIALWTRGLAECPDTSNRIRVLTCLYPDRTVLVYGKNREIIGVHVIRRQAEGPLATDAKALAARIRSTLQPELEDGIGVQWLWCGPLATDSGFPGVLNIALAAHWQGECITLSDPATFLARALAMRLMRPGALAVNFRAGEFAHPALIGHAVRRRRRALILLLVAASVLFGINMLWRHIAGSKVDQEAREVTALAGELAPGARIPVGMEVREARRAVEKRSGETAAFRGALEKSLMPDLAAIAGAAREHSVSLGTLTLRDSQVEIAGAAPDWPACERFAAAIKVLGFNARLERQSVNLDGRSSFSLKGDRPGAD